MWNRVCILKVVARSLEIGSDEAKTSWSWWKEWRNEETYWETLKTVKECRKA